MSTKLTAQVLSVCLFSLLVILAFCLSTPYSIHAGTAAGTTSTPLAAASLAANYGNLPLSFERNDGQTHAQVKFLSRGGGYSMFLTSNGAVLVLSKPLPASAQPANPAFRNKVGGNRAGLQAWGGNPSPKMTATVLRLQLAGEKLNPAAKISGSAELPGHSNYFRGSDRRQWVTNIPNYRQIEYRSVYPGVDMVYYGNQRQLEYDMVVAPYADPSAIRFQVQGAQSMEVAPSGDLMLHTSSGDVVLRKPVLYQQRVSNRTAAAPPVAGAQSSATADQTAQREPVDGSYAIQGNEIQFQVGAYDNSRPLVIDPVLSYSTFLGGSNDDQGAAIAADATGNAYVVGQTFSSDFPVTDTIGNFTGTQMAFITKISADGSTLLYSTYLGGSNFDYAAGIAVDASGNAYVTGTTFDSDFPVTSNAYQMTRPNPNSRNVFVSKLNPAGNTLLYSTYLGGQDNGGTFQTNAPGSNIAVEGSGVVYIVGNTSCDDFPILNGYKTTNPLGQGSFNSVPFIAKIDTTKQGNLSLLYSTYLGGTGGGDIADAVATNGAGKVYITGATNSTDFPTVNAFQSINGGFQNAFLSVLDTTVPGSNGLIYSSYLGGSNVDIGDVGAGIAVDSTGKVDVTGSTSSFNFPVVTTTALRSTFPTGSGDCLNIGADFSTGFVSQFDPTQSGNASLVYSTFLGGGDDHGQCNEGGMAIATDSSGKVYVTGQTDSLNFPLKNPLQAMSLENGDNAFVSQLDLTQAGSASLLFSTYLAGSKGSGDHAYGVAVDSNSANVYITGVTDAFDFPTVKPLQPYSGGGDAFVAKINMAGASPAILLTPNPLIFNFQAGGTSSAPKTITVKNVGTASLTISAISINSSTFTQTNTCGTLPATVLAGATCAIDVTYSPPQSGNWSATLTITDNALGSPHKVPLTGAGSTVALTSSLNPSSYFDTVTFTATVSAGLQGGSLTGMVQFKDGTMVLDTQNLTGGVATSIPITFVTVGSHNITAQYSGDAVRTGGMGALTQTVNPAATTTTVTSSQNPSSFGNPPVFTAVVAANNMLTTPIGTVAFKDGATVLGTMSLDDGGQAIFTPSSLSIGTHPITAVYQGDAINWAASTSGTLTQTVLDASTLGLAATISNKPAATAYFTRNPGQKLTLTVTITGNVTSGTPTGTATFVADSNITLGTAPLQALSSTSAKATFPSVSLNVGPHQIACTYSGNTKYGPSTSNTVNVSQSPRPKIR